MIYITSTRGEREMSALVAPKLGFGKHCPEPIVNGAAERLNKKMSRSGIEAARRKFTPEFMNRIDKVVVFKPLGEPELRRILDLELSQVQQRILQSPAEKAFVFTVSNTGKDFLLAEGTDVKYGARHLKRAIQQYLVHPLSNLLATNQVMTGDWIQADFDAEHKRLLFTKEAEGLEVHAMARILGDEMPSVKVAHVALPPPDLAKTVTVGKSKK
jgi:ATP-dependent Clp protease ATP-binding subunit ClpA